MASIIEPNNNNSSSSSTGVHSRHFNFPLEPYRSRSDIMRQHLSNRKDKINEAKGMHVRTGKDNHAKWLKGSIVGNYGTVLLVYKDKEGRVQQQPFFGDSKGEPSDTSTHGERKAWEAAQNWWRQNGEPKIVSIKIVSDRHPCRTNKDSCSEYFAPGGPATADHLRFRPDKGDSFIFAVPDDEFGATKVLIKELLKADPEYYGDVLSYAMYRTSDANRDYFTKIGVPSLLSKYAPQSLPREDYDNRYDSRPASSSHSSSSGSRKDSEADKRHRKRSRSRSPHRDRSPRRDRSRSRDREDNRRRDHRRDYTPHSFGSSLSSRKISRSSTSERSRSREPVESRHLESRGRSRRRSQWDVRPAVDITAPSLSTASASTIVGQRPTRWGPPLSQSGDALGFSNSNPFISPGSAAVIPNPSSNPFLMGIISEPQSGIFPGLNIHNQRANNINPLSPAPSFGNASSSVSSDAAASPSTSSVAPTEQTSSSAQEKPKLGGNGSPK